MMQLTKPQRGVGLVTAIFLLVVIAGLAAAMVTVFTVRPPQYGLLEVGTAARIGDRLGQAA